ncbi:hypothetical protein R70331_14535 [Paenibacillus sp. FSL R7-0331]|nr:hypothetical protein R70331_14535 [Paenibacillus sp. FSL R7-0331]
MMAQLNEICFYSLNFKSILKERVAEGNFGTVGAVATAFVCGFQPREADKIKKSADNSGWKSKYSLESRRSPD